MLTLKVKTFFFFEKNFDSFYWSVIQIEILDGKNSPKVLFDFLPQFQISQKIFNFPKNKVWYPISKQTL